MAINLRPLSPTDSLEAITTLLHRAYARLGAMGLNYTAVDQTAEVTRQRFARGQGFVLANDDDGCIVGTIVVNGSYDANDDPWARASPWYYRGDVAHFHQFAVDASLRGAGWGDRLVATCEAWAKERGFRAMALDTAMPASHLRARYARLGYRDIDEVQWPGKVYRSVVMSKPLHDAVPGVHDPEHGCARIRTWWAHLQARDWAAARALLADGCSMHWPVTRERFLDADTVVRVQATYPEGWSIRIGEVFAAVDGRVVSTVTVTQDQRDFHARSIFAFNGEGRVTHVDECWGDGAEPLAWRTPAALGAYARY